MKNENFITIQGWMVNELGLSGNDLICYALVYGFSQDEESEFSGSLSYVAGCLNITKQNARKVLLRLVEKGLIVKRDEEVTRGIKLCRYSAKVKKDTAVSKEQRGMAKTATDNKEDNIEEEEEKDKSFSKKDDYLPIAAESQQEYGKVLEKKEWREDFNAYLNLVNQAKRDLLSDSEYKAYIEKYYPNADYENSVGKLVDGFWGTEEGWNYCKKKRKGKTINMLATLKKNLDARSRIVYKPLQNTKQNPLFNSTKNAVKVKLNPNVHLVDNEGKLSDGTFLKSDGLRYYFSYIDKKTYSIPLDAEPMPQSEKIAYDYKTGWYECE